MNQENQLMEKPKEEDLQIQNIGNNNDKNKIIIENDSPEFEKPEDIKTPFQDLNNPTQNKIPSLEANEQNSLNKNNNIILPQNINDNLSNSNVESQNNNPNFSINVNTDQSYNASYSNDVSSFAPSKKNLGKKTRREYLCEEEGCKKVFYDKCAFRKHLLTHGEKLYSCEICHKKFLDNSKLRRHSLVHSGEKPFACPLCPKKFSLDFNLRTHMRIHSGEKPYACVYPGCFKRFSQSSNLSAHEKTHELMKKEGGNEEINNKPIFSENPLKYIIENPYSGTPTLNNINKINEIYEMMKKGMMLQMNSFNQSNGNQNYGRNHCEIPGMPLQKRTYIKKANKENNNLNTNYGNGVNCYYNNNNFYNNNYMNSSTYYNNNLIGNQINDGNLTNLNPFGNQNIINNNLNNPQIKQSRKLLFQIQERDNSYKEDINLNNNFTYKSNQNEQSNKQQTKKQIFMTYRDPINPNKSYNFINNNNNNENFSNINNVMNNYDFHNEDIDQENKEEDYNEEERPDNENYDIEDIREDKEFENFKKFI